MNYVIGLGSNLGSRRASLQAALALLDAGSARVLEVSQLYESDPVGPPQPRYYNAAVRVDSDLPAQALLAQLLAIEAQLGRRRDPAQRSAARTIDLDILWAQSPVSSAELSIPHPQLRERRFALAPLLEVAPELAAEYGPVLAALGAKPSPIDEPLDRRAPAELRASAGGIQVAAIARDRDDALAAALGALGRGLFAPGATDDVQVLSGAVVGDPLSSFVRSALDYAARGFAFTHATVCELGPERFEGRLLGAPGTVPARLPAGLRASDQPCEGGRRVSLELAP
jgi:2-amino-4-hydroxy-6-hydroxymethyldihydropteridine diphosphokinase